MENEQNKNTEQNTNTNEDYIKAIEDLKANSVDKESYDKLREENRNLLNSLVKGEYHQEQQEEEKAVDITALRKELLDGELNNLEFAEKALQLRSALIAEGKGDPFVADGLKITASDEDIATADKVAEALQWCVDEADGNSEAFTNRLQEITVDSAPRKNRYQR